MLMVTMLMVTINIQSVVCHQDFRCTLLFVQLLASRALSCCQHGCFFLWLNAENLKECFGSLERRSVHGHSFMRLGREFENVKMIEVLSTQFKVLEITLEC